MTGELIRLGLVALPDAATSRVMAALQREIELEFGLRSATRIVPNLQLVGPITTTADVVAIREALDPVFARHPGLTFRAPASAPRAGGGVGYPLHDARPGAGATLVELVEDLRDTVRPFRSVPDPGPVSRIDHRPFELSLPVSWLDLSVRADLEQPVIKYVAQRAVAMPEPVRLIEVGLHRLESDDWDGAWWSGLRWRIEWGWRLPQ